MIEEFFSPEGFPARWHCGEWPAHIGWMHIVGNLYIMAMYWSVAMAVIFGVHRDMIRYPSIKWFSAAFFLGCGAAHLAWVVGFYFPVYRPEAYFIIPWQCVSVTTAIVLFFFEMHAWASPKQRDTLEAIADTAPPFLFIDVDYRVTYANQSLRMLTGFNDELIGRQSPLFDRQDIREIFGMIAIHRTIEKSTTVETSRGRLELDWRFGPVYKNGKLIGARGDVKSRDEEWPTTRWP